MHASLLGPKVRCENPLYSHYTASQAKLANKNSINICKYDKSKVKVHIQIPQRIAPKRRLTLCESRGTATGILDSKRQPEAVDRRHIPHAAFLLVFLLWQFPTLLYMVQQFFYILVSGVPPDAAAGHGKGGECSARTIQFWILFGMCSYHQSIAQITICIAQPSQACKIYVQILESNKMGQGKQTSHPLASLYLGPRTRYFLKRRSCYEVEININNERRISLVQRYCPSSTRSDV